MNVQIRARDKDPLAEFLGWFSIGLGTAQVAAPRALSRLIGADDHGRAPKVMRLFGLREIAQGAGILTRPRPTGWLWSRVAGDALDLSLLAMTMARHRRMRTLLAIANVAAVALPDVNEARRLSRKQGPVRAAKRIRKAVTIRQARGDVERAWASATELRREVEEHGASVRFDDAPGGRGTEVNVEFDVDPAAGDLGAAVRKLSGRDLATQLSDDLRRFKQQVEAGEVIRSDGSPEGHLLAEHLRQRAAQPQPREEVLR